MGNLHTKLLSQSFCFILVTKTLRVLSSNYINVIKFLVLACFKVENMKGRIDLKFK